jgi:hypothetical protein
MFISGSVGLCQCAEIPSAKINEGNLAVIYVIITAVADYQCQGT